MASRYPGLPCVPTADPRVSEEAQVAEQAVPSNEQTRG
jgi:hypothetical protein